MEADEQMEMIFTFYVSNNCLSILLLHIRGNLIFFSLIITFSILVEISENE